MSEIESTLEELKQSVIDGNMQTMEKSVDEAIRLGIPCDIIITNGLSAGMCVISDEFNRGKIYLPQVVASSKVMEGAITKLGPLMERNDVYKGVVIMGSVMGDIHEIGKNVCVAMLRGAGYKVINLGPDVRPDRFVSEANEVGADIVGGSALMTTTLSVQGRIVKAMKEDGNDAFLIFGGAPCTQAYVDSIGGDGYSSSGYEIVKLADRLMAKNSS